MVEPNHHIGGHYMKKYSLVACCLLLLPAAALGQEKDVYTVGRDMVVLVDAYAACAGQDAACTEDDALALQADAENMLHDIAALMRPGRGRSRALTADQALQLSRQFVPVHERLVHVQLFDAACNFALRFLENVIFLMKGLLSLIYLIYHPSGSGGVLVDAIRLACAGGIGVVILMVGTLVPVAFILMAPCLFWWL